jgi:hypothetical protein
MMVLLWNGVKSLMTLSPGGQVKNADELLSEVLGVLEALGVEADLGDDFVVRFRHGHRSGANVIKLFGP